MSVDVSALEDAVRAMATERGECLADSFVATAQGNAPVRTGELASSIHHDGVSDTGSSVMAEASVAAEYGVYVEFGRGGESGLLALQLGGETIVVESVGPMQPEPFWSPTVDVWDSIVAGCA